MLLPESWVWALDNGYDEYIDGNLSGIKVFCDEAVRESVAGFFINQFSENWKEAELKVEKEYGGCENVNVPAKIINKDYGFFISLGHFDIRYCWGEYYDFQFYGYKALERSLKNMKTNYPQIEYEGDIGQGLSDSQCGSIWQEEISSIRGKNVDTYDFIGEILNDVFNTDERSDSWDDFWEEFRDDIHDYADYADFVKALYAYSKYIPKEYLDRAVRELEICLDTPIEEDDLEEDDKSNFLELVEKLKNGEHGGADSLGADEDDSDDDEDSSDPIDGYMVALEAFLEAEEYENELADEGVLPDAPRFGNGVTTLSPEEFPRIAQKAEDGDERAIAIIETMKIANEME